jgi:serine/threonine protein kinase
MKTVCLHCQRTSPNQNLFCQESYCPAEESPQVLEYGEQLGDIEIIRPIGVLRSSVLYEAQCNRERVLLKIAHPGKEHTDRLKREVALLRRLQSGRTLSPSLPCLLAPYTATTAENHYGRVISDGQLLYYAKFAFTPGDTLRDALIKNPQLWVYHIGWIVTSLAQTIAVLQSEGVVHGGISPDSVLIHFDPATSRPKLQLFDFGIACEPNQLQDHWYRAALQPAYTAPELIDADLPRGNYATDVYGIGLVLYELLVGRPAFPFSLAGDSEVYDMVCQHHQVQMNRFEDVKALATIAVKATSRKPTERYENAVELATELTKLFPPIRPRYRLPGLETRTILWLLAAFLVLALIATTVLA